jgi:phosphoribosylpyrophosphate synthetase
MSVRFKAMVQGNGLVRDVATPFTYPGGELHLKEVFDYRDPATVWIADVRFNHANDLVHAALLANVAHHRQMPFVLFLPYLPAARADRGTPVGAEVYAEIIRSMNPQQIVAIDPHSSFIVDYFRNILPGKLTVLDPTPLLKRALGYESPDSVPRPVASDHVEHYDAVIAPDKGALPRATKVAESLGGVDLYHAEKHREQSTGKILSYEMAEKPPVTGRYLVVDDICDGGATFNMLAELTELPREKLGLWVTHGIFSGNAPALRMHYDHIYTTDSHPGHGRVVDGCAIATSCVPVETYMFQNLKNEQL